MPFIRVTTNVALDQSLEERLRQRMAVIVRDILGKDPIRMMSAFEGNVHICRGDHANRHVPTAFIECKFFGGPDYPVFEKFDTEMKAIYREILQIQPENLYIKYEVINGFDEQARLFKV